MLYNLLISFVQHKLCYVITALIYKSITSDFLFCAEDKRLKEEVPHFILVYSNVIIDLFG